MKEKTKNIINSFSYNRTLRIREFLENKNFPIFSEILLEKFLIIYDKAKEEKKSFKLRRFVRNWQDFNNEVDKLIGEKKKIKKVIKALKKAYVL